MLVGMGKVKCIEVNFLPVGHTHIDIDQVSLEIITCFKSYCFLFEVSQYIHSREYIFVQVFSCISRHLIHNHAFSLLKLQALCDKAYSTKSIVQHLVMDNSCNWTEFMKPLVIPKEQFVAGISQVHFCTEFFLFFCEIESIIHM